MSLKKLEKPTSDNHPDLKAHVSAAARLSIPECAIGWVAATLRAPCRQHAVR
jgi:hypothetical protein